MTIESRLRQAMQAETTAVPMPANRWEEIEARAADARRAQARRRAYRRRGGIALVALAATAAAVLVLPALHRDHTRRVVVRPAGHSTTVAPPTSVPSPTSTTVTVGSPSSTTVPSTGPGYQPLYPFSSLADANSWRAANEASGAQPWHLDARMTALSFVHFLGYTDITATFGVTTDATGAHVTVGFLNPNGDPVDSAVVHLRRFGTASDAPWEVVGTDDTPSFSVTAPRYGSVVNSPLTVGGGIVGVDESIRIEVLQLSSSSPIGVSCCQPAGNGATSWSASVTLRGATDPVLIVTASAGGGLVADGQFAVTGVRTTAGTTPGL